MALSGTARPLTLSGSGMHIQSLPARAPLSPRSPVATPAPGLRSPVARMGPGVSGRVGAAEGVVACWIRVADDA